MIRPNNQSCYLYFKECTKDFGSYNVIENYGNMISHKKFLKDIDAIAGYLDKNNIKRGDVVTIFLPNIPQCFAAFYAVNKSTNEGYQQENGMLKHDHPGNYGSEVDKIHCRMAFFKAHFRPPSYRT